MSIRSTVRNWTAKALVLVVVAAFAITSSPQAVAQSGQPKPVAVIALNNVNSLLEDINFIGSLGGQPRMADSVRPLIGMLQGLDTDQSIGLVIQSENDNLSGALCIPAKDFKMMLGGLAMFGISYEEGSDGTFEISAQGQNLVARESNGWAFITMMPQWLENTPANPGELFSTLTKEYDLGVRVHVQNIPEAFKQIAISQLQAGMEAGMQQLPNESDEKYEARKKVAMMQVDQLQQGVKDLDEITFGLAIDGEQQRTFFDFVYTAVAGSKLAEQLVINNDPKTDFAGFLQPDAAMMMSVASKLGESDVAQVEQMFGALSQQVETAINEAADDASDEEKEIIESAVADFMAAAKATLEAGKMDGGAVLNLSPSSLSFVAGGFIADPAKVESGVKKLTELAKKENSKFPGFNWNAKSHRDVQFHTLSMPIPEGGDEDEENARKLFGNTVDVAIGIGKQSVYFSLGRNCLEAVQGVMDASAAAPQKSVPIMEMTFALSQIMETVKGFMEEDERAPVEMIGSMLAEQANGRDHVRIIALLIPNGARTRIELEEGVLRAIGMGAMAARMQGAGAGGF